MTALDLGTASRVLTPPTEAFSSVPFGDITLTAYQPYAASTWRGIPAIPMNDDGNDLRNTDDVYAEPLDRAIFFAVAGVNVLGPTDYHNIWWHRGGSDLAYSSAGVQYVGFGDGDYPGSQPFSFPTAITNDGVVVFCLISNSVESRFLTSEHGTVLADANPQLAAAANDLYVQTGSSYGDTPYSLLGIWQFDSIVTETDAIDTMAAMVASIEASAAKPISVAAGWGLDMSVAAANVETAVQPDPEPPVLVPGGAVEPPADPVFVVPANAPDPVIRRISKKYSAPTEFDDAGFPVNWEPDSVIDEAYARMQITIEGTDISWINGVPTPLPAYSRVEPFGSYGAEIVLPQISVFHATPSWAKKGANVTIRLVRISDGVTLRAFTGAVLKVGRREDKREFRLTCHGIMFIGDLQQKLPGTDTAPRDIGHIVADAINAVRSKRYDPVAKVTIGQTSSVIGGWVPVMSGFVQEKLATAITDGAQWTVKCEHRTPVIAKKDVTTVHWTVRAGQPGIDIDIEDDAAESENMIYGSGINEDGGRWRNMKYPNWKPDETPAYPYSPPDTSIKVGTTDGATDTGNGVSLWQEYVGQPVTGYFSSADRTVLMRIQRDAGITVDGYLGPQSWATTFNTGANTGSLEGAFQMPLAFSKQVMERLYNQDGEDRGPNPDYDPNIIVVDRNISFGAGVAKAEATRDARALLARNAGGGYTGDITFKLDPPEGSKYEIREGHNVLVEGVPDRGDILMHIASVDADPKQPGAPVRARVDERARDYPTLDAIRAREREAVDPARIALNRLTTSELQTATPAYDAESPAGRMPKHAVYGGLWDIRPMPIGGKSGSISRMWWRTTNPASRFVVAAFAKKLTPAQLSAYVPNPLSGGLTESPWQTHRDVLREKYGFMIGWGWYQQPAGYFPRDYNSPNGTTGAPVTGRLEDEMSFEYASANPPWIYIATYAESSCEVEGRFYGMPSDW